MFNYLRLVLSDTSECNYIPIEIVSLLKAVTQQFGNHADPSLYNCFHFMRCRP